MLTHRTRHTIEKHQLTATAHQEKNFAQTLQTHLCSEKHTRTMKTRRLAACTQAIVMLISTSHIVIELILKSQKIQLN